MRGSPNLILLLPLWHLNNKIKKFMNDLQKQNLIMCIILFLSWSALMWWGIQIYLK